MSRPDPPDPPDPPDQPPDAHLVVVICNGPWRVEPMAVRLARASGRLLPTAADRALAAAVVGAFPDGGDATEVGALLASPVFAHWLAGIDEAPAARRATARDPGPLAHLSDLPTLAGVLDVPADELAHLARWHRPDADSGPTKAQHYRYLVRPTRNGGVRVLEIPKERLKQVQRRVLRRVLETTPVHPAAYGSSAGRGVVAAVAGHAASGVVLSVDIERFFTAVTATRVSGWFVHQGVGDEPARLLARLCTNGVPRSVRANLPPLRGPDGADGVDGVDRTWWRDRELSTRHLPQGAPTSPAVADRICRALDVRLAALAARHEVRYTRYVDDLTFSGDASTAVGALRSTVETIVRDEGFRVAAAKTRVQRSSGRQRVLGAVVNHHPTLSRHDRDALKATVHNCRVHGWRTQLRDEPAAGFRERLTGRVAWLAALDPVRGRRLLAELAAVDWT